MTSDALTRRVIRAIRVIRKTRRNSSFGYESEIGGSETRTKYALVDPILKALGWDLHDPSQVKVEYPVYRGRVDYALFNDSSASKPSVLVEAKSLSTEWYLSPPDAEAQLLSYAERLDIRRGHGAITNGKQWNIYKIYLSKRHYESSSTTKLDPQTSVDVLGGELEVCAEGLALIRNH